MSDILEDPINWAVEQRDKFWKKKVKELEFKIKCMYTLKEMNKNFKDGYEEGKESSDNKSYTNQKGVKE